MDIDLPYLSRNRDRHGNIRLYVRKNGGYVHIREKLGTPELLAAVRLTLLAAAGYGG